MKVAIIADIHGNLDALKAVIEDIRRRKIKDIICAGDIVGYGPEPDECVDLIRKNLVTCVRGNHEQVAVTLDDLDRVNNYAKTSLIWTNKRLSFQNKQYLKNLPITKKIGNIFVVHGSPFDPLHEYVYEDDDMSYFINSAKSEIIVMAHTHIPYIKMVKKTLIINPGSVGQPRDDLPEASYCVLDTETKKATIIRLAYDIDAVEKKIKKAKLPGYLGKRLHFGK